MRLWKRRLNANRIADKVYPLFAAQMDYLRFLQEREPDEGCPVSLLAQMTGTQTVVVSNMFKVLYQLTDSNKAGNIIKERYRKNLE